MKLRNPGSIQPAPTLQGSAGELAEAIARWPGVKAFTHWRLGSPGVVDGSEFHVGDPELGHVHLDGMVHIPLNSMLASLLVRSGLGHTPSWSDTWITCPARSQDDLGRAAWMFRLAYARIRGVSDADITDRITNEVGLSEPWSSVPTA